MLSRLGLVCLRACRLCLWLWSTSLCCFGIILLGWWCCLYLWFIAGGLLLFVIIGWVGVIRGLFVFIAGGLVCDFGLRILIALGGCCRVIVCLACVV